MAERRTSSLSNAQAVVRAVVVWLVLLTLENLAACARAGAGADARLSVWVSGQLCGIPIAIAALLPLAVVFVVLGRLVQDRRAPIVGLLLACVACGFAIALSAGPHMRPLVRRVPFVVAVGGSAFGAAFAFVRVAKLDRAVVVAAFGAGLAVVAWIIDQRVLPGLYPAFHIALELATLGAAAAVALAWRPRPRPRALPHVYGIIVIWAAVALVVVLRRDGMRQALLVGRPIEGRVMLSLMQVRSAIAGQWEIGAGGDANDPDVSRYLDTAPRPRALDWSGCDVLLFTIDALRADHVGAYGYPRSITPNVDKLAAQGMRFEHAYAPAPSTSFALTSIMAGGNIRPIIDTGARLPAMWPEYLRKLGYQTFGAYAQETLRVDDRFAQLRDSHFGFEHVAMDLSASSSAAALASYLASAASDRPVFAWIHALEPHSPYDMHPEFPMSGGRPVDAYDSEIAAVDAAVASAVQAMQTRRRCVVTIVTADHGESFGEHGAFYHGTNVYEQQLHVPLIVVGPGVTPGVVDVPVQTIDLLPTMLSAIGRGRPESVRGHDIGVLMTGRPVDGDGLAFAETDRYTMVAAGNDRLICDREARACSLYDIVTDPGQSTPIETRPDRVRTLRKLTNVLGAVQESAITLPWRRSATDDSFGRGNAVVDGDALVATGAPGTIVFGPYIKVPAGQFELVWRGRRLESAGQIAFSVRSHSGANISTYVIVDAASLPESGELVRIPFVLDRPRFDVELVVESAGGGRVALTEAELIKNSDDPRGRALRLPAAVLPHRKARIIEADHLIATGEPGPVSYGPFLTLAAGAYTCTWIGRGVLTPGRLTFSVYADGGRDVFARTTVASATLTTGELIEIPFTLDRPYDRVELAVTSSGGGVVILDQLVVRPR
jgi:arylsulfatase A-like enzyme